MFLRFLTAGLKPRPSDLAIGETATTLLRSACKHFSANARAAQNFGCSGDSAFALGAIQKLAGNAPQAKQMPAEGLEIELQRELECSRVVRRCGLACGAFCCARGGIADRVHAADVEAIQHVETIGDHL